MDHEYIVDCCGCVIWDPVVDDYVFVREEELDLLPNGGD